MKVICSFDEHIKEPDKVDSSQWLTILAAVIEEDTRTDEAKALQAELVEAKQDPAAIGKVFDDAMKKTGISECPSRERLVGAAETQLYRKDVTALCGEADGELAKKLAAAPDAAKRVASRTAYYQENIKSAKGLELWKGLQDDSKSLVDRAKLVGAATKELTMWLDGCGYLTDVAKANDAVATAAYDKGVALADAEGDARDLKAALGEFERACKLSHEQACRRVPLTRVLLNAETEPK